MRHAKETGISSGRLGLWHVCVFTYTSSCLLKAFFLAFLFLLLQVVPVLFVYFSNQISLVMHVFWNIITVAYPWVWIPRRGRRWGALN